MDSFFARAAEVLELDATDDATVLRDCDEWDSLTALSLVAMIDKHYRVTISADDLKQSATVGDLRRLVAARTVS
jgi:acyl carrier protein